MRVPAALLVATFLCQAIKWPTTVRCFLEHLRKRRAGVAAAEPRAGVAAGLGGASSSAAAAPRAGVAAVRTKRAVLAAGKHREDAAVGLVGAGGSAAAAPRAGAAEVDVFVDCVRYATCQADGQQWREMFRRMNAGLMNATTGLAVQFQHAGLLRNNRSRGWRAIKLGPAAKTYYIAPPNDTVFRSVIEKIWELAERTDVVYPTDTCTDSEFAAGLMRCLAGVLEFARAARTVRDDSGTPGCNGFHGGSGQHEYNAKSMARGWLIHLERSLSDVWGRLGRAGITMEQIMEYAPDERDHAKEILPWNVRKVYEHFAPVTPSMVTCWACLFFCMEADALERAKRIDVQRVVDAWRGFEKAASAARAAGEVVFPPGPRILVDVIDNKCDAI